MSTYFTLDRWITLLQRAGKEGGKILTPYNLQIESGLSLTAIKKSIQRLRKKGYIAKLKGNFYANTFAFPSLEEIAMLLGRPCYISFESAMEKHGIISQMPLVLTCATSGKTKNITTPIGEISLHHIHSRLFTDYFNEGGILWAKPEKALLDYIYIHLKVRNEIMALDEINWEGLNKMDLRELSSKYPKSVKKTLLLWNNLL
ncbi:MAG: type IV toxin-antitoxin system AbiEi family antitoxin domain-containing protein [bacterium]